MKKHTCAVALSNKGDLLTSEELEVEIIYQKKIYKILYEHYSIIKTNITLFNFCPFCGKLVNNETTT